MEWNLLADVLKCKNCTVYRANKFMIDQVRAIANDNKFEAKAQNSFLKRQMEE